MKAPLTKHQRRTFDAIFQHPITHHLHRRDVNAMFGVLAEFTEESNGNMKANHPDVAKRVVGTMVLEAQHCTEDQLLAKAREFYEKRTLAGSGR